MIARPLSPYFLRIVLILSFAALLAPALAADAATLLGADRSVLASTFIDSFEILTDDDSVGFESSTSGPFIEAAVGGVGLGDLVNATGEATQDSEIEVNDGGGIRVEGGGAAGGLFDVAEPGFPSRAQTHSDSQLSITFSVDEASPYVLSVSLFAELAQLDQFSGTGPLDADLFATARLYGVVSGLIVEREVRDALADDAAVTDAFTRTGVLAPDTYVLEIVASTFLRGFEDAAGLGTAGFGVSFEVVPEPGTAVLIGLGLAFLSSVGRQQRRIH